MKIKLCFVCLVISLTGSFNSNAQTYNIKTFAGDSDFYYCCDGGTATAAQLNFPSGVAVDTFGNIFITDTHNNRIRKVNSNGIISLVAGNGIKGYSGDGGFATSDTVELNWPQGIAVDDSDNIYVADVGNNVIRKINTNGVISLFAGNGTAGYSGDGKAATSAKLNYPIGVAVDISGNVYVADDGNNVIRKINSSGIISTYAGNGTKGYSGDDGPATKANLYGPYGVAVDKAGNIYIADGVNNRIRKVNKGDTITTVAGNGTYTYSGDNGPATAAGVNDPIGVNVDDSGNIYISDFIDNVIRKVNTKGIITTFAGNDTASYSGDGGADTFAELNNPVGISSDALGNVYIADGLNYVIRKVNANNIISTVAGNGFVGFCCDGNAATAAELWAPFAVALDTSGNVYITDTWNNRIRKVTTNGIISTVAGNGYGANTHTGGYSGDGGLATAAELFLPNALAVDDSGNIYFSEQANDVVRKISTNGIISTIAGNGKNGFAGDGGAATAAELNFPTGVAVDDTGNVYIADADNHRIRKVNTTGIISTFAGGGSSGDGGLAINAGFKIANGVAIDNKGNVYIVDGASSVVHKVNVHDTITEVAGNHISGYSGDGGAATAAELDAPQDISIDNSGNIYIGDVGNNVIRKVNNSGIISTIAGNGVSGYAGDGGAATAAELNFPVGVAVNAIGNVFIADVNNERIRELTIDSNISTGTNSIQIKSNSVNIYPNPNFGNFTVQLQNIKQNTQVEIFNILNERIFTGSLYSTNSLINLSSSPEGIYFYRVLDMQNNLVGNGKFVLAK